MDANASSTTTIRQRSQLTIPGRIRKYLSWVRPNTVVNVSAHADKIVIKPVQKSTSDKPDWKEIREKIKLARSFKGKRGNLSQFIVKDRERH
jgi:bifunctional DNA-binding transcriptional regulator/antitoxin component of YhaV-PrlF toxin-antitoxin module